MGGLTMVLGVSSTIGFIVDNVINVIVFIAKGWLLVFVMMWVRWTLPRLRIDQVMMTCLKYFLPISCALLLGVSAWLAFVPEVIQAYLKYLIAFLCVGGFFYTVYKILLTSNLLPTTSFSNFWIPSAPSRVLTAN